MGRKENTGDLKLSIFPVSKLEQRTRDIATDSSETLRGVPGLRNPSTPSNPPTTNHSFTLAKVGSGFRGSRPPGTDEGLSAGGWESWTR